MLYMYAKNGHVLRRCTPIYQVLNLLPQNWLSSVFLKISSNSMSISFKNCIEKGLERKSQGDKSEFLYQVTLKLFLLSLGCGGSFEGNSGNFTSPGYPNKYAENLRCLWNITVDEKYRIHFDFIYVEIEAGDGCLYDYLLFRDGLSPRSPALAKICHSHLGIIKSTGPLASVLFVSDSTVGYRGFHLAWKAVPQVPLLLPDGKLILFLSSDHLSDKLIDWHIEI